MRGRARTQVRCVVRDPKADEDFRQALLEYAQGNPNASVDDMLWWLYEHYKIVVGTRTVRRVFERTGSKIKPRTKSGSGSRGGVVEQGDDADDDDDDDVAPPQQQQQYRSPYASMAAAQSAEQQLVQAFQQQQTPQTPYPPIPQMDPELADDEETLQLQLRQIELEKREVELKLRMRRLQQSKSTPTSATASIAQRKPSTPQSATSTLYNPIVAAAPTPPKRDSRSKKKIEESKKRTAERQERMLKDLERRSRRRDHLTAEWVQSKDIWPLRAQGVLADLMHQYGYYTYTQNNLEPFETMYRDLYQLVDLSKGDWNPQIHDEMLRERMKRKMGQLRTKMQKSGEIVGRTDGYGGFQRAENFTGEAAGQAMGDENEDQTQGDGPQQQHVMVAEQQQQHQQAQQQQQQMRYDQMPDPSAMQHAPQMPYMMPHAQTQYPMMTQQQLMGYASMGQQGEGMMGMS